MRRVAVAIVLTACALASSGAAHDARSASSAELIVKWRTRPARLDAEGMLPEFASNIVTVSLALPDPPHLEIGLDRIFILRLADNTNAEALRSALACDPRFEYVEFRQPRYTQEIRETNREKSVSGIPNDPFFSQQWALDKIRAPLAWDITRGSSEVVIAIVDVGVDFGHPDLAHQRWSNAAEVNGESGVDDDHNGYIDDLYGYDFVEHDGDPTPAPPGPDNSHGTHVAGIAAAERNNGRGIAGVAPDCKLMGVRAGAGRSVSYGYEGIYYACRAGAKIINCSWGGEGDSGYERDIIQYVQSQGCIVVAAAGNDGQRTHPLYPAGIEGVVSVAATAWTDRAAAFTHFGPWVKICAPGVEILSTVVAADGLFGYSLAQGTSMAAPYVAGVLALVAAHYPALSSAEVIARVVTSAHPVDDLNSSEAGGLGLGRLDAFAALTDSLVGATFIGLTIREVAGNLDGRILPGESAEITLSVRAELTDLHGLRATANTSADSVLMSTPVAFWELVPRGTTAQSITPLRIELPFNARRGRVIPLALEFSTLSGVLLGRSTIPLLLDSTYVTLANGSMQLGFAENGSLGFEDYPDRIYSGPGLILSGARHYGALHHGSFVLAADGFVCDNFFGDTTLMREDWVALPDSFARRVESARAPLETRADFSDRGAGANELFASVTARGLAYTGGNSDRYLVLEYTLTNRSLNPWRQTYVGLALDWDLAAASRNFSAFAAASAIASVSSDVLGFPRVGVVALTGAITSYAVLDNRLQIDPPGAWSDEFKWSLLTSGIHASPVDPLDLSQLLAIGPFELAAHTDTTLAFALIWGDNDAELRAAADSAHARYAPGSAPLAPSTPSAQAGALISPNPALASDRLTVRVADATELNFTLYNILGQEILTHHSVPIQAGRADIDLAPAELAAGLFFYNIQYGGRTNIGKLLIVR